MLRSGSLTRQSRRTLIDLTPLLVVPKNCRPLEAMDPTESRRLWKDVTEAIHAKQFGQATKVRRVLARPVLTSRSSSKRSSRPSATRLRSGRATRSLGSRASSTATTRTAGPASRTRGGQPSRPISPARATRRPELPAWHVVRSGPPWTLYTPSSCPALLHDIISSRARSAATCSVRSLDLHSRALAFRVIRAPAALRLVARASVSIRAPTSRGPDRLLRRPASLAARRLWTAASDMAPVDTSNQLTALRELMSSYADGPLDAWVVPTDDAHAS